MAERRFVPYARPSSDDPVNDEGEEFFPDPDLVPNQVVNENYRRLRHADQFPLHRYPTYAPTPRRQYITDLALLTHDKAPMHNVKSAIKNQRVLSAYKEADLVRLQNEERDRLAAQFGANKDYDGPLQYSTRDLVESGKDSSPIWREFQEERARRKAVIEDRGRMGAVAQLARNMNPAGYSLPVHAAANIINFLAQPDQKPTRGRIGSGKISKKHSRSRSRPVK